MAFDIEFDNEEFVPFEGMGSDLLPKDGDFEFECTAIEEGESGNKNKKFVMTLIATDEDAQGNRIVKHVPVSGKRTDGKLNVLQLKEALFSLYSGVVETEDEAISKVNALLGKKVGSEKLMGAMKGKKFWGTCHAQQFERDNGSIGWSSSLDSWISKQKYDARKAIKAHRKPLPPAAQAFKSGADAETATSPATSNGTASTAAAAAPAGGGVDDALGLI